MKTTNVIFGLFLFTFLTITLSGCAPGPNSLTGTAMVGTTQSAGFWLGLWHNCTN